MSDLIERLERTPEIIYTDEDQCIAELCDEAVHEIVRLRKELKESNAAWQRALLHAVNEIERLRAALDASTREIER